MKIQYEQLSYEDALRTYADWILQQESDQSEGFLADHSEWYMIFYPLRTLLLAGQLLKEQKYIDTVLKYVDIFVGEQLPNGGFTSNYRRTTTEQLSKKEFQNILRTGKVNIADVGSNTTGVIQAACFADGPRRERYLASVKHWLDDWVPIWALKEGGYGNGIWNGHKKNSAYTCAMSTLTAALSAFTQVSGETEYIENAERCLDFQFSKWMPDGRPIFLNCYPREFEMTLDDYGHMFYLLEGMCWTHYVSKNAEFKARLEKKMTEWIFGEAGILTQWDHLWFSFARPYTPPYVDGQLDSSRHGIRIGWELAKSNGILHAFSYYLNHIEDNAKLRDVTDSGLSYLSHPLRARMSGVASELSESYGKFALQATGFAGLSLAEGVQKDSVFNLKR